MKHTYLFILLLAVLSSCNNSTTAIVYLAPDFRTFDTAVYFQGFYASEDYVNKIKKYKSPKLAQDSSESITIPEATLKPTFVGYNFHEGAGPCVVVKKGKQYELMYATLNDSTHKIKLDTFNFQPIEVISDERIKIGKDYFVKIKSGNVSEELLFAGKYQSTDGASVEFLADGKVKGLDKYAMYAVMYDYYDVDRDVDQVSLGTSDKDSKYFAFKFKGDTLLIYDLKQVHPEVVDFGKLKYTLVKKK